MSKHCSSIAKKWIHWSITNYHLDRLNCTVGAWTHIFYGWMGQFDGSFDGFWWVKLAFLGGKLTQCWWVDPGFTSQRQEANFASQSWGTSPREASYRGLISLKKHECKVGLSITVFFNYNSKLLVLWFYLVLWFHILKSDNSNYISITMAYGGCWWTSIDYS